MRAPRDRSWSRRLHPLSTLLVRASCRSRLLAVPHRSGPAAGSRLVRSARPLLYMTNQIRFYPFSDRIDRFHVATITLATWDIGAALMTTAIEAQLSDRLCIP